MKEAEYALRIEQTMDLLGLRWHHETDSRRSKEGFLDYCIVGPGGIMFLEIKSDTGKATPEQKAWVADLVRVRGVIAYIAWPKDWDRVLSDLKKIAARPIVVHMNPPVSAADVARSVGNRLRRR